jgi:crotonobetainyl-CoA:carnitine CoA-transferase CaiB-like acyl-CoA transferase
MVALDGVRVVELCSDGTVFAGKLLAELGAEVVLVEPPGGSRLRSYGPFLEDRPGPERSLHWWHYNTSKRSVVLDLDDDGPDGGRELFRRLVDGADVVLEAEAPDRLAALGIDHHDLRAARPSLVHCSITPFGRTNPRRGEVATDLTVLAGAGPVWSCGYDDHSVPPVRGGGNQGLQTAGVWAVMSILTALLHRDNGGSGQHLDVSMHAASNVTTEMATYGWLVARREVQRQTGRHASPRPTDVTQVRCADGRYLNTGVPPRRPAEFRVLHEWLVELGLVEEFPLAVLLEMGGQYEHIGMAEIEEDPMIGEVFGAGRDAVALIASRLSARDAFVGFQQRGLPVGAVFAPEDIVADPHFVARGFPVAVEHEDLGRSFVYPGTGVRMNGSPAVPPRRAPHLGEHDAEVLGPLRVRRPSAAP